MNNQMNNKGDEMYYKNCIIQIRHNSTLWTDEDINWFKQYVISYELTQTQGETQSVETQGQQQSVETQGQQQSAETQGHQDITECDCDCRLCVAFADDHDDMWEAEQRRRVRRQRNITNKEKEDAQRQQEQQEQDDAAFDAWEQYYQSAEGIEQRRRYRKEDITQGQQIQGQGQQEDDQTQGQGQQEDDQDAAAFDDWVQYYQSADGMDDLQQSRLELDLENYRQSAIEDNRE